MSRPVVLLGALASAALALASADGHAQVAMKSDGACVPVAAWVAPGADGAKPIPADELLARAARGSIVLLGESHDNAEHHRWQLQTIAALHGSRPNMVLGFEMFPRRVQGALDRWVSGALTESEFLAQSDWREVWRIDPQLYLPIFHFARMNRIPMLALNVEPGLTREISQKGFDAIPAERLEGVGRPAAPTDAYVEWLLAIYADHGPRAAKPDRNAVEFQRFVESQQTWDRAMAERLAAAAKRPGSPLVVGVMGSGHIAHGYGVPHQLRALGVTAVSMLLPWDRGADCTGVVPGLADALFGVSALAATPPQRQRLGVGLETAPDGVRIRQVEKGSIADAAGIREGDVVVEAAGVPARQAGDLADAVQRQAPGTWLPLKIKRGADTVELVAKFPPLPK